jgi:hypothetical protein
MNFHAFAIMQAARNSHHPRPGGQFHVLSNATAEEVGFLRNDAERSSHVYGSAAAKIYVAD